MNNTDDIMKMNIEIPQLKDISWLLEEELKMVKSTLEILNIEHLLNNKYLLSNALNINSSFEKKDTEFITLQNILLDNKTRIEITSSPGDFSLFSIKVFHLEQENEGKLYLRFISNLGGEVLANNREEYVGNVLENPNLFTIYNDMVSDSIDNLSQISTKAWYSKIPCISKGCCIIKEPLYPGASPTIPIIYKWCGANCGSGTPVNSVDTCCRTHDKCYIKNKSYPKRCSCDTNIIKCVSKKGTRASGMISAAFKAKKKWMKCKK